MFVMNYECADKNSECIIWAAGVQVAEKVANGGTVVSSAGAYRL